MLITYIGSESRKFLQMVGDRYFLAGISKLAKLHSSLYSAPMYIQKFSYRGKHSVTQLMKVKENLGMIYLTILTIN